MKKNKENNNDIPNFPHENCETKISSLLYNVNMAGFEKKFKDLGYKVI